MRPSYRIALSGVLGAAAVTVMALGTIIPVGTFCCPAVAGLLAIPVLELCGKRYALCWYAAVSLLSLLLAPDREAALIFLALGHYPVLRPAFHKLRRPVLRTACKLLLFNFVIGTLYGLLLFVIGMESVTAEFEAASAALLVVMLLLGNLTFFLYDLVLARMAHLWRHNWQKKLQK